MVFGSARVACPVLGEMYGLYPHSATFKLRPVFIRACAVFPPILIRYQSEAPPRYCDWNGRLRDKSIIRQT